jgi:hypothetical protein
VNTKSIFSEIVTTAIITANITCTEMEMQNLLMMRRLNAPGVNLQRHWTYEEKDYLGHGRPTETIIGPSVDWVVTAMEKLIDNDVPFFVLCGPQHQQKTVCVVLDKEVNTLQVTCLTSQGTFHAEFRHIWEIILDAPVLPVELRSSMPMPYAKAAKLQKIAVGRAEVTIENVAPAQAPYQKVNPDAPWTNDEIADCRIQRTNAMTERHQLAEILAPRIVPRKYLHSVVLQNSMGCTVEEITARILYHYMATVRRDHKQNQTSQVKL